MHAIREARALAHEEGASTKELAPPARVEIWHPDRGDEIHAEQLGQFARVDKISLGARLPNARDVKRVGDTHRVPVFGELGRQPVPVQRRLEPDGEGSGHRR